MRCPLLPFFPGLSLRASLWVSLGLALGTFGAAADARAQASAPVHLTLQQAFGLARSQSPSAVLARHRYLRSHWEYRTFKADYRPSLDLSSTPAEFERTIAEQRLPDGTDAFVRRSQANSSAQLSLNKVVSWTGGNIALYTTLARTTSLEGDDGTSFYSIPIAVSYEQPLFAINNLAWGLRIEPLRYREARQQLTEDLEQIASSTISTFFDLLTAQSTLAEARKEHDRAETLLVVMRQRFDDGRASENDVLQAQLANLNADLRVTRAQVDVDLKQQNLGTLLGVGETPEFDLTPPADVPRPHVDLEVAIAEAHRNRPTAMSWERQLLEADKSVAAARASRGYASISASYGLSQTASRIEELYRDPRTDQVARVSLDLPIVDWGRTHARVAVAESQREVTRRQIEQARSEFDHGVFLRVTQFRIQERQLELSALADSIARRRYAVTHDRVLAGQADLTSLDIAQREMDSARRGWFDALRSYWTAYYDLRRTTLHDFERGEALEAPRVRF